MQAYNDNDLHGGERWTEVKIVNNALCLPNLVRRTSDPSLGWRWPSWRSNSTEVKYSKNALWAMATKLRTTDMTDDLHGGLRSNVIKYCKRRSMAIKHGRKSLMTMTTLIEVKGQQRSNMVIYVIWLPHLVRCTPNTSYKRMTMTLIEVIKGQIVHHALWLSKLCHWEETSIQIEDSHVLNRGQRLREVKYSKVCFNDYKTWSEEPPNYFI